MFIYSRASLMNDCASLAFTAAHFSRVFPGYNGACLRAKETCLCAERSYFFRRAAIATGLMHLDTLFIASIVTYPLQRRQRIMTFRLTSLDATLGITEKGNCQKRAKHARVSLAKDRDYDRMQTARE